jgi:hypothetical protein
MTPLEKQLTRPSNFGSLQLHSSLIDYPQTCAEKGTSIRGMYKTVLAKRRL